MENKLILNNNLDASSTSFHGNVVYINPKVLFKHFGEGNSCDEFKVSKEWIFKYKGRIFTLYDWKSTNLYDENYPSVSQFWNSNKVCLHIGCHRENKVYAYEVEQILSNLK